MKQNLKYFAFCLAVSVFPTILIWIPFFARFTSFWNIPLPTSGMATIVANYDGPLYIVVAKTLYAPELIRGMFNFSLPAEYYPAHFPLYPILIKLFSPIFGYPYSMLFVTLASSVATLFFFFLLAKKLLNEEKAYLLTFVFSIFPARWLIVRSVGSAEPLFVALIIASIYYFIQKKYLLAGIIGMFVQFTKSPGVLLFVSYVLTIAWPKIKRLGSERTKKWLLSLKLSEFMSILLIPLALGIVFLFYKIQVGDFFAYFKSGDNIHLFFPPFQVFNYAASWVGTFWLEEIIFVYLIATWGLIRLVKMQVESIIWFVAVFLSTLFFVSHRDILRYAIPIVPFLILGYSDILTKKEFRIVLFVLIVPIYLFSIVFISQNTMPITDWAPLL